MTPAEQVAAHRARRPIGDLLFENEMRHVRIAVGLRLVAADLERVTTERNFLRMKCAAYEHREAEGICTNG